jgi:hypothetical protein
VGSVFFFFKLVFEFCVFCSERFNMLCHGHARSPICERIAVSPTWEC